MKKLKKSEMLCRGQVISHFFPLFSSYFSTSQNIDAENYLNF